MSSRVPPRPDNAVGHVSDRSYPGWMYAYPDARTTEILRLKEELADRDELIVSLVALIEYHFHLVVHNAARAASTAARERDRGNGETP